MSFQCSKHATPAGIVGVFNHCANFQKDQDLNAFVSVVVLDEVGLAEDSENMPLKVKYQYFISSLKICQHSTLFLMSSYFGKYCQFITSFGSLFRLLIPD